MTLEQKVASATRQDLQILGNRIAQAIISEATNEVLRVAVLKAVSQKKISREEISNFLIF